MLQILTRKPAARQSKNHTINIYSRRPRWHHRSDPRDLCDVSLTRF